MARLTSWIKLRVMKLMMRKYSVSPTRAAAAGAAESPRVRTVNSVADLEELQGQEIGLSDWITIDQPMIDAFAKITLDEYWTHTDPERCQRESPFGQTIVHGAFTMSLITHLVKQAVHFSGNMPVTVNYGFNRVRFPAPALSGGRFRLRLGLIRVERKTGSVQMYWDVKIEAENSPKPCMAAEWITRTYLNLRLGG